MEDVRKFTHENVCIILVGIKSDLSNERVVSFDEGRQLADSYGIKFFEASAKENLNIDKVFLTLARDVKKVFDGGADATTKLKLDAKGKDKPSKCY